jgi:Protein of unknown function, DUF481
MRIFRNSLLYLLCFTLFLSGPALRAQPPAPAPDIIIFPNGDKLSGHFVSATRSSMKFHSDALGDITIDWSKIKELHTAGQVAVIREGEKLAKHSAAVAIPQGSLNVENKSLQLISPLQPPQTIPLSDTGAIVDQQSFEMATSHSPGLLEDWTGTVTLGASLVNATQENRTFTGAIGLTRAEPSENWLAPINRTSLDFAAAYGDLSQPKTPTVKTSIFDGDIERDQYFSDTVFAFGRAGYDHNFSQGLDLQQTYSGGAGWTLIQKDNETLDLKAGLSYLRQQFQTGPDMDLIGSIFDEHVKRGFKRGLVIDQHLSFEPAWNNSRAFSGLFSAQLTMPVSKRVSASTGIIDTFLNDPPPGFQKNSFQFTLGFSYVLK